MTKNIKEEYKKCLTSPAYFINNYILIKDADGNLVRTRKVTDKEVNELKKNIKDYGLRYPFGIRIPKKKRKSTYN